MSTKKKKDMKAIDPAVEQAEEIIAEILNRPFSTGMQQAWSALRRAEPRLINALRAIANVKNSDG